MKSDIVGDERDLQTALPVCTLKRHRYPYRWILKFAPLHALAVLRYEAHMTRLRLTKWAAPRRFSRLRGSFVNLGCGDAGKDGWFNIDSAQAPGVTCVYDCRKRLPLPDAAAKAIFTEHLLEHLDYDEEVPLFLRECYRVLEPGGVLRIVVPDGQKYLEAYATRSWGAMRDFSPLAAGRDPSRTTLMELVNEHFRQAGQHRFSYDYETLQRVLTKAGFAVVARSSFGTSLVEGLAIDNPARATESLYVEAAREPSTGNPS